MGNGEAFGRLLRQARQRALLTLEGLAGASGVSARAISDMERGRSLPRQATLGQLMDALDLAEGDRQRLVEAAVPRPQGRVPRQLPPDLAGFRGRTQALAAIDAFASRHVGNGGHVVVSAVGGMAGVGKTTLAVHWAHRMADHFPDGQLYVNLRGFAESGRPLDPGEVLGDFLTALGVDDRDLPRGTKERTEMFRRHTEVRRLIVVLDNASDEEQVRPLLPASAGSLAIITSRNRLSGLAVSEGAHLVGLDVWSPADALTALAARIGDDRCLAEPEAAAELVSLCGHLPLAIAVVGAQVSATPDVPLRITVRELEQARLDTLSAGLQRADVRAAFSWSYQALTPAAARLFRHLALHPGPSLSPEAAASLAGLDMAAARRHLRALTSASLLSRDANGHYVLHDLLRAYAAELFAEAGEDRLGAQIRLLDYLRHNAYAAGLFVSRYQADPPGPAVEGVVCLSFTDRDEALEWYRSEEATVSAALRDMADPQLLRPCVDLVLEWVGYNSVAGRWSEERFVERLALDAALILDDPLAAVRSAANLARALHETGNADEVNAMVEVMLRHMDRIPGTDRARAELNISWLFEGQGRYPEAVVHTRRSLSLYRAQGEAAHSARALSHLGGYLAALGEFHEAIAVSEEAIPELRRFGDLRNEANAYTTIGLAQQGLGETGTAVTSHQRSLCLYEKALDDYGQADALNRLAAAQLESGQQEEACASWLRAAELLEALSVARAADMRAKARAAVSSAT